MAETLRIDPMSVYDLGLMPYATSDELVRFSKEVLVVANDSGYQRLVRAFLALPEERVNDKAEAMIMISDYGYAFGMPEGQLRDSAYVSAAFKVVILALLSPEAEPHE